MKLEGSKNLNAWENLSLWLSQSLSPVGEGPSQHPKIIESYINLIS